MVSAIGHETDFTIADFVADLRAPTPSAAAELITEAQHKIAEHLATQSHRLERAARFQLLQARQRLTRLPVSRAEARMAALLHRLEQRLDDLSFRMEAAMSSQLREQQSRLANWPPPSCATIRARGWPRRANALAACRTRLDRSLERTLHRSAARLSALDARLHSLSPLAVLDRGYALVLDAKGALVRSTTQVARGDKVTTRLSDGAFISRVESAASNTPTKK